MTLNHQIKRVVGCTQNKRVPTPAGDMAKSITNRAFEILALFYIQSFIYRTSYVKYCSLYVTVIIANSTLRNFVFKSLRISFDINKRKTHTYECSLRKIGHYIDWDGWNILWIVEIHFVIGEEFARKYSNRLYLLKNFYNLLKKVRVNMNPRLFCSIR